MARSGSVTASMAGRRKEKSSVDKEFVLEQLFQSGMSIEDIAKVINISKTSLKKGKLSDELKEVILDLGVTTTQVPEFGTLNPDKEFENA